MAPIKSRGQRARPRRRPASTAATGDTTLAQHRTMFSKRMASLYDGWLRGGLWHTTSLEGYRGIRQGGAIVPNAGDRPFKYPRLAESYGFLNRYVCLFDFSGITEEQLVLDHWRWASYFTQHHPTVALQLDRNLLAERLIPNSAGFKTSVTTLCVPYVEAWYPVPIPASAILAYLVLSSAKKPPVVLGPDDPRHADYEASARGEGRR